MVSWAALDKILPASGGKITFHSILNWWGHTWSIVSHSEILIARETWTHGDSIVKGHKDGEMIGAPMLWRKTVRVLRLLSLEKWNNMMDIITIYKYLKDSVKRMQSGSFHSCSAQTQRQWTHIKIRSFPLNIMKYFHHEGGQTLKFSREVVNFLFLEIFKNHLDTVLGK